MTQSNKATDEGEGEEGEEGELFAVTTAIKITTNKVRFFGIMIVEL